MHLDVHVPRFTWPGGASEIGPTLASLAQTAEGIGVRTLSVMDHWFQMERMWPAEEPMLEGYSTLSFVAASTERLRLRLLVTGVTYRPPGLLAKTVTTLDVLSGGRAELGIGAAWYEREHRGLGVPFPPIAERFERLEEALQICLQMWSDDNGPYNGRHYQLAETLCSPPPVSVPRPRILIGGSGERKTLRLVARYADACNLPGLDAAAIAHKLDVLRARRRRARLHRDRGHGVTDDSRRCQRRHRPARGGGARSARRPYGRCTVGRARTATVARGAVGATDPPPRRHRRVVASTTVTRLASPARRPQPPPSRATVCSPANTTLCTSRLDSSVRLRADAVA
jgi:F420-dependent oxidoreductase-like protein